MAKVVQTKFNSGEMAPTMQGQLDHQRYLSGLNECTNCIPRAQGGVTRRMGSEYLGLQKDQNHKSITYTHQPETGSVYSIEFGHNFVRFWKEGVLVELDNPSNPLDVYSLATDFSEEMLPQLSFSADIDIIRIYHKSGTKILKRLSVSPTTEDWSIGDYVYKDGPYNSPEDTDTVLTVTPATYILKLEGTAAFSDDPPTIGEYLEYKKKNQWQLGKVLGTASTPPAPTNPTANTVYIEPVRSIVRGIDTSAKLGYNSPEIRSTIKVFNNDLVGSFVRIEDIFNTNNPLWARISSYEGLKDYPKVVITNPTREDLVAGHTYRISEYTSGSINNGGFNAATLYDTFTLVTNYTLTTPVMVLEDLNTLKQLDTVNVETPVAFVSVSAPVVETVHVNECPVTASSPLFGDPRDIGRSLRFKLGTKYVSSKIAEVTSTTSAKLELLNTLPYKENTNELQDNGVSTEFSLGTFFSGNYPVCGLMSNERHLVAGSPDSPDRVSVSEEGKEDVFTPSDEDGEVLSTSAFSMVAKSDSLTTVRWMVESGNIIVATESSEHLVRRLGQVKSLTPETASIDKNTSSGSLLKPVLVGNIVIFVQRSGNTLNELQYSYESESLGIARANTEAEHIFISNDGVVTMAYQQSPDPVLWFCMGNGTLATLTFDKGENVLAWARHELGGGAVVEWLSIASSADGKTEWLILHVLRDGLRTIERLARNFYPRTDTDKGGMVFLDSHTRVGPGATEVTGLDRFIGKDVTLVIDGTQQPTVLDLETGTLALPKTPSVEAYVGLKYSSRIRPIVPTITMEGGDVSAASKVRLVTLYPFMYKSLSLKLAINGKENEAIDVSNFVTTDDLMDESPPLTTGYLEIPTGFSNETNPDYVLFTDSAYPMTILNLVQEIEV